MASGGGHVTAVSSYIAYARALNRLGWTPAEFVVAESFTVRLRGMLGRQRNAACHGVSALFLGSHLLYGLSHRHRLYRSKWQCSCLLRKRSPLEHVLPPMRLGHAGAPLNSHRAPCFPTGAGLRIGDS